MTKSKDKIPLNHDVDAEIKDAFERLCEEINQPKHIVLSAAILALESAGKKERFSFAMQAHGFGCVDNIPTLPIQPEEKPAIMPDEDQIARILIKILKEGRADLTEAVIEAVRRRLEAGIAAPARPEAAQFPQQRRKSSKAG